MLCAPTKKNSICSDYWIWKSYAIIFDARQNFPLFCDRAYYNTKQHRSLHDTRRFSAGNHTEYEATRWYLSSIYTTSIISQYNARLLKSAKWTMASVILITIRAYYIRKRHLLGLCSLTFHFSFIFWWIVVGYLCCCCSRHNMLVLFH